MGCDIHLFVEYKNKSQDGNWWFNFGEQFRLDRDYRMFTKLAGVRSYGDGIKPISEPRGMPENVAWKTKDANRLLIVDHDEPGNREVSRATAKRLVRSGASRYNGEHWVTDPDWHSHSWLTADEFSSCVESFDVVSAEYKAVVDAMRCLQKDNLDVRVVFWFDN